MNQYPQRPKMTREEYMRRKKLAQKRRRNRRIALFCLILIILVVLIVSVAAIIKRQKSAGENRKEEEQTLQLSKDSSSDKDMVINNSDGTTTDNIKTFPVPDVTFQADLSSFEQYMAPEKRDDFLLLVNKEHPLSKDYIPDDLVLVVNARSDRSSSTYMREPAEKALEALFLEAQAEGMTYTNPATGQKLSVMSAYRSYQYQYDLYRIYVDKELNAHPGWTQAQAQAQASTYSAMEGTSEHQSGLCCDMHNLSSADQSFQIQEAAKWLDENCWKFGFILRFPQDKEEETGFSYEPWHFRFVGRYHAYQMKQLNMCLDEYCAYIRK